MFKKFLKSKLKHEKHCCGLEKCYFLWYNVENHIFAVTHVKGRAPTALENYLLNKRNDKVYRLPSMSERAGNYASMHGISVEEATARIKYADSHRHEED